MADFTDLFFPAPDGLKLHARRYGAPDASGPPVICLPGLTRTAADFDVLAKALTANAKRQVVALDYRGRGESAYDPEPRHYNVAVELGDVIALLTALKLEPAIVIGTSRGGILTMLLAAARPGAIVAAVLNDIGPVIEPAGLMRIKGYVGKMPPPKDYVEAAQYFRRLFQSQFPRLTADDWLASAERGFKSVDGALEPTYDVALAQTLESYSPEQPMPALWEQFDALANVPLMAIHGALSDLLSKDTVAAMRARHPALEVVEVPDQGHAPLLADGPTIARIEAFIAKVEAARSGIRQTTR